MLCRYACYYLTRNSLTYTAPVMVSDPTLKMDITQVGLAPSLIFTRKYLAGEVWQVKSVLAACGFLQMSARCNHDLQDEAFALHY